MALVTKLEKISLEKQNPHTTAACTYALIEEGGETLLQIDTYGSLERMHTGKKSQSIRFSRAALKQLKTILEKI